MDEQFLHHVDVKNPHSFESKDLEKLIKKVGYSKYDNVCVYAFIYNK
jgi:hypothetical protein